MHGAQFEATGVTDWILLQLIRQVWEVKAYFLQSYTGKKILLFLFSISISAGLHHLQYVFLKKRRLWETIGEPLLMLLHVFQWVLEADD